MRTRTMSHLVSSLLALALLLMGARGAMAAQQYQGLCSLVKIEIQQELTLERIGFLATLEVTNNEGDASITNFSAQLTFQTTAFSDDGTAEDASDLFFVQPPDLTGINGIDGTGIIPPGKTAHVEWFLIPTISAGGMTPEGVRYMIGAELGGMLYGQEIPADSLQVVSDMITVRPEPQLEITYFQPRDVLGDNPFTPDIVETPVPFTLGVMVNNVGFGAARKLKINSEQPRIVDNSQGLLMVPFLLGSRVDDEPTDHASLLVDLGDIQPSGCRKGAWDMITTLSGEFTEFSATYTHAPELGGDATSVIVGMDAFFIVHEVLNDLPGRDGLRDFLAVTEDVPNLPDSDENPVLMPDTLFETDCNQVPVNRLETASVTSYTAREAKVHALADIEGWVFILLFDPHDARVPVTRVERSDGKILDTNNFWTHLRYRRPDNARLPYLYIFDFVQLGEYDYTVTYDPITDDTDPPVSSILFAGEHQEIDGVHYVLPDTQIFFVVDDASSVGTWRRLDGEGDFLPAYPFTISEKGEHTLEYYSKDVLDNQEDLRTATIVVSPDRPAVTEMSVDVDEIFLSGGAVSVRPSDATVSVQADAGGLDVDVTLEVFKGAHGWPTLKGVPATPTRATSATLVVGGENVDYYRFKTGGVWSDERPTATPIELSGLSGVVSVKVKGRSQYGDYHPDDESVLVGWTVDAAAPATEVTTDREHPTRASDITWQISGVEAYRWTLDDNYYRAETAVSEPIVVTRLEAGDHQLKVVGRAGGGAMPNPDEPASPRVTASHTVDHEYGLRFDAADLVYSADLGKLTAQTDLSWDGHDKDGDVAAPGWYTVKVSVTDPLGRTTAAARLVRVGDLLPSAAVIDDPGSAGQDRVDAADSWVVWQDQRSGTWDIWAIDLDATPPKADAVLADTRNHERPRTDGTVVVWQARQPDGNWDIWARNLGDTSPAFALTQSVNRDEIKPVVHWPWVVWQERRVSDPSAPWQLVVGSLIDGGREVVEVTIHDQLDPAIYLDSVVWQDFRDVGYGEIYMKNLHTGDITRITNDPGGQYHPDVHDHWIVWADNRDTQIDIWGRNLLRGVEVQLTDSPENETRPSINGRWVAYEEDAGASTTETNLRVLHVASGASVQLTNSDSTKRLPRLSSARVFWVDDGAGNGKVMQGKLPDLQPVADNRNMVALTEGLTDYVSDAYSLLRLWNQQAGVRAITRYTALAPSLASESANWVAGHAAGTNFPLEPGGFVWVIFDQARVLDFSDGGCHARTLPAGASVLSYACFPDDWSAHRLIRSLGITRVNAIRALDAESGRWVTASVVDGAIRGEDFRIEPVAVVLVDLKEEVTSWTP